MLTEGDLHDNDDNHENGDLHDDDHQESDELHHKAYTSVDMVSYLAATFTGVVTLSLCSSLAQANSSVRPLPIEVDRRWE